MCTFLRTNFCLRSLRICAQFLLPVIRYFLHVGCDLRKNKFCAQFRYWVLTFLLTETCTEFAPSWVSSQNKYDFRFCSSVCHYRKKLLIVPFRTLPFKLKLCTFKIKHGVLIGRIAIYKRCYLNHIFRFWRTNSKWYTNISK